MKKMWKNGIWLFILFGLCIVACVVLSIAPPAIIHSTRLTDLTQNHQQWMKQTPKHYRYALLQGSMAVGLDDNGVLERVIIEVQDGAIISLHDGRKDRERRVVTEYAILRPGGSIEKLFMLIQDAIDRDADRLDVRYNAQFGYPEKTGITYHKDWHDDWIGFSIEDFEVLP